MRFAPVAEVNEKRQLILKAKAQFLIKVIHLRLQGQMRETIGRIETWLGENLERLYNDEDLRNRFAKFKPSRTERDVQVLFANKTPFKRR